VYDVARELGLEVIREAVYAYSAYGETAVLGPDGGNALRYTGREDDGNGLFYYRARYYDPVLKRFVSEDPIGLEGGFNLYGYVHGDPVSLSDPTGEFVPIMLAPAVLSGTGMSAATGIVTTAGALIVLSARSISGIGQVPTSIMSFPANSATFCPSDDDCAKRLADLEKRFDSLARQIARGFNLGHARALFNRDASNHNVICPKFRFDKRL
jgi:RHS repeat-associated protein